jgi:hypothetical protein
MRIRRLIAVNGRFALWKPPDQNPADQPALRLEEASQ